tara:strand:- start:72 stop:632 length:561 start_codon:yes stop_codon:yes gene_type:complete
MELKESLIIKKFLTKEESKIISRFILETEDYVKSIGPDKYSGTGDDSLSGRHWCYNYLHDMPGKILIPKIKDIFGECVVQCWANTFRNSEGIKPHRHCVDEFKPGLICANVFLYGPNPGTWYDEVGMIMSEIGTLVMFPNDHIHSVPPNKTDCVRVSMAFDIYTNPDDFNMINEHPLGTDRYIWIK